ncbi:hypothetical protein I4U23_017442 [Adineta vaga]|nr:hypothetical protein I4U23_017442 [Adineta vaga]
MNSNTNIGQDTEIFSENFVSAGRYRGGPHGVGDPSDKSLRKVEIEVCIPGIIRQRVHRDKCHDLINDEFNQYEQEKFCMILYGMADKAYKPLEENVKSETFVPFDKDNIEKTRSVRNEQQS